MGVTPWDRNALGKVNIVDYIWVIWNAGYFITSFQLLKSKEACHHKKAKY